MWIVYHEPKLKIAGISACGEHDGEKKDVIKEIVNGLRRPEKFNEYNAIQETDPKKVVRYLDAFPDKLAIAGSSAKPRISIRDKERYLLYIDIDAPDRHPVDGIPEIKADGKSSTLITILKVNDLYQTQTKKTDTDEIFFRTDHGILRNKTGNKDINSVKLVKGKAVVRLYSEAVKRVATIKIFSVGSNLRDETLQVEFI